MDVTSSSSRLQRGMLVGTGKGRDGTCCCVRTVHGVWVSTLFVQLPKAERQTREKKKGPGQAIGTVYATYSTCSRRYHKSATKQDKINLTMQMVHTKHALGESGSRLERGQLHPTYEETRPPSFSLLLHAFVSSLDSLLLIFLYLTTSRFHHQHCRP